MGFAISFRSLLSVMLLGLATCQRPAPHPVADEPDPPQPEADIETTELRRFRPSRVTPEAHSKIAEARQLLEDQNYEGALALLSPTENENETPSIEERWLRARSLDGLERAEEARTAWQEIAESDNPLAPWARLIWAQHFAANDPIRSEVLAPLTELDWAGRKAAVRQQARLLINTGDTENAEVEIRRLLHEDNASQPAESALRLLLMILETREDATSLEEAIEVRRDLMSRAPGTNRANDDERSVRALLRRLPRAARRRLAEPNIQQRLRRARTLARRMRHQAAADAYASIARESEDQAIQCEALLGQAKAIYYRRQRGRAAEMMENVAEQCPISDIRAWALYYAGRGHFSAGHPDRSLEAYARLETLEPQHTLADDARYRAALVHREEGRTDEMLVRLSTIGTRYPEGDMQGRARFMLAWHYRNQGAWNRALEQLEANLRADAGEEREDLHGRSAYWRADTLRQLGREDEADAALHEVIGTYPLSYYSQQAYVRLTERSPARAERALTQWGVRGSETLSFEWNEAFEEPAFQRIRLLLRLGESAHAREELAWFRAKHSEPLFTWIEAALMNETGNFARAIYLTRRHLQSFMQNPPTGEHFARWRIAYPNAFAPMIDEIASNQAVPASFVRAIAREESSFRPHVESYAHAYGLVQLILPTARRFGRPLGLNVNPTTLRDPETNLRIGTAFMGWLRRRYPTNPALVPAAYNAGQGAVDRWLREHRNQTLDEWIENIPYDETRRYSRRVLQTRGIYDWLNRHTLTPLPPGLPNP